MFDHLPSPSNPQDKHSKPAEDRGINLLPANLRHSKKHASRHKLGLAKGGLHLAAPAPKDYKKKVRLPKPPRQKSFSFSRLFSIFKTRRQKKESSPAILSMNVVKSKPQATLSQLLDHPEAVRSTPAAKSDHQPHPPQQPRATPHTPPSPPAPRPQPYSDKPHLKPRQDYLKQVEFSTVKPLAKDGTPSHTKDDELDVNLLPKREHRLSHKQIILTYVMLAVICLLAVATPYFYYQSQHTSLSSQNLVLSQQLDTLILKKKEAEDQIKGYGSLAQKLSQLLPLLDNHTYWSKYFPTLEKQTAQKVYFTSIQADPQLRIVLSGQALTLRDLAEQLVVFQNSSDYLDVHLDTLTLAASDDDDSQSALEFSLSFNLQPSVILLDQE